MFIDKRWVSGVLTHNALALATESVELTAAYLGQDTQAFATSLNNLAAVQYDPGGIALSNLGLVHKLQSDYAAAERCYREALDILSPESGSDRARRLGEHPSLKSATPWSATATSVTRTPLQHSKRAGLMAVHVPDFTEEHRAEPIQPRQTRFE
jgi:hypothetical protein